VIELQRLLVPVLEFPFAARALDRVANDIPERLPVAQNLVEPIGRIIGKESLHLLRTDAIRKDFPRQRPHLEVRQRAVAIEGDVFGPELLHLLISEQAYPARSQNIRWPQ